MKVNKTSPDRKALEAGFLILSLLPPRAKAVDTIKEVAGRVRGLKTRILRDTSYERCGDSKGQLGVWSGFWGACKTMEAPGAHASDAGFVVPEYPFADSQDVSFCDLKRLSEAVWHGVGQAKVKAKSQPPGRRCG